MNPNPMRLIRRIEGEPTRQEIEMAHIEQMWAEWRSPNPDVSANNWKPIQIRDDENPLPTDEILRRSYREVDGK